MKYLLFTFTAAVLVLFWLVRNDQTPNEFADGRLACAPIPPAMVAPAEAPLETPAAALAMLGPPPVPVQATSAKLMLSQPEPIYQAQAKLRYSDPSDWGIPDAPEPTPVAIAHLATPKLVNIPPAQPPEPEEPEPNLYLPEGAFNEEGAILTLIKAELHAYQDPDIQSQTAPFVIKEGEKVRPMTRLRNEDDFDWIKIRREGRDWWVQAEYFIRVDPRNRTSAQAKNLAIGLEAVDKDSALPPDYTPSDMVSLSRGIILDNKEVRLRREAADALERMTAAAEKAGVKLRVISGFRTFDYQKKLYLEALEKHGPKQKWVAAPGYSEHQLGTTIDISGANRRYMLSGKFANTSEGRWLHENAGRFGFRKSYTQENSEDVGYRPEPWHFRYVGTGMTAPEKTQMAKN